MSIREEITITLAKMWIGFGAFLSHGARLMVRASNRCATNAERAIAIGMDNKVNI